MNVERMHRIILDLDKDLIKTKVEKYLNDVVTHLQNQINEPTQSVHQTKLVQALDVLYKALDSSAYNSYSPSWLEAISELSTNLPFGINLKLQVQNIFSSNLVTPAKALEDIKSINENLKTFHGSITSLIAGLKTLNVVTEVLSEGE